MKMGMVIPAAVLFLFITVLASLGFFISIWNWRLSFQNLWKVILEFWWRLHWICRQLLVAWWVLLYSSYRSMSTGELSIFRYHLIFFNILKFCYASFFLLAWLELSQDIYIICERYCFPELFLSHLSFVNKKVTDCTCMCVLMLHTDIRLKVFMSCQS